MDTLINSKIKVKIAILYEIIFFIFYEANTDIYLINSITQRIINATYSLFKTKHLKIHYLKDKSFDVELLLEDSIYMIDPGARLGIKIENFVLSDPIKHFLYFQKFYSINPQVTSAIFELSSKQYNIIKNNIEYNKGTRNKTRLQKLRMPDKELEVFYDRENKRKTFFGGLLIQVVNFTTLSQHKSNNKIAFLPHYSSSNNYNNEEVTEKINSNLSKSKNYGSEIPVQNIIPFNESVIIDPSAFENNGIMMNKTSNNNYSNEQKGYLNDTSLHEALEIFDGLEMNTPIVTKKSGVSMGIGYSPKHKVNVEKHNSGNYEVNQGNQGNQGNNNNQGNDGNAIDMNNLLDLNFNLSSLNNNVMKYNNNKNPSISVTNKSPNISYNNANPYNNNNSNLGGVIDLIGNGNNLMNNNINKNNNDIISNSNMNSNNNNISVHKSSSNLGSTINTRNSMNVMNNDYTTNPNTYNNTNNNINSFNNLNNMKNLNNSESRNTMININPSMSVYYQNNNNNENPFNIDLPEDNFDKTLIKKQIRGAIMEKGDIECKQGKYESIIYKGSIALEISQQFKINNKQLNLQILHKNWGNNNSFIKRIKDNHIVHEQSNNSYSLNCRNLTGPIKLIEYKINISEIEPPAEIQAIGVFNSNTSKFKLEIKILIKKELADKMKGAEMAIKFNIKNQEYSIVKSTDTFNKKNNTHTLIIENFNTLDKKLIGVIYDCNDEKLIEKVHIAYRYMNILPSLINAELTYSNSQQSNVQLKENLDVAKKCLVDYVFNL